MSSVTQTRDLAVVTPRTDNTSILIPLASPEEAKFAIGQYEALKSAIVQPQDWYESKAKDNQPGKKYLKKSFWRRIATCFGLSLELVESQREQDVNGALAYSALYRAIAPNGRTMIGDGYCSRAEPGHQNWPEHNIRATAHTRAKNRAISDLVGGGEVSAEEIHDEAEDTYPEERAAARQAAARTVTGTVTHHQPAEVKPIRDEWDLLKERATSLGGSDTDWANLRKLNDPKKVRQLLDNKQRQLEAQRAAEQEADKDLEEGLLEEDGYLAEMADAQSSDEEPQAAPAHLPEEVRKAILRNAAINKRLHALDVRTLEQKEAFLDWAESNGAEDEIGFRAFLAEVETDRSTPALETLPTGSRS